MEEHYLYRTPATANFPSNRIEDYHLYTTIGKGCFGEVKIAKDKNSGKVFAIKIIDHATTSKQAIEREIAFMKFLKHPNIIKLEKDFETETHTYLVMEYAAQGDLFEYIVKKTNDEKLCEDDARKLFQQIISGVKHCHDNKIIHRDLKLDNLLVDSHGKVKIADFGSSDAVRYFQLFECIGTLAYMAPEVLSGKLYGFEADIWSCGVVLYTLLCGTMPFEDKGCTTKLLEDREGEKYDIPKYLSSDAKDLIKKMLTADQTKRITISKILKHPWLQLPLALQPQYVSQHMMQQSPMVSYLPQYVPQHVPVSVPQYLMHQYAPPGFSVRAAHLMIGNNTGLEAICRRLEQTLTGRRKIYN